MDEGRSKLLMGVGGIVLGLICLVLGLFLFLHSKKGEQWWWWWCGETAMTVRVNGWGDALKVPTTRWTE